jgi:8-oxo-dGTP pyrophosphatase MutT (NUDIX family)
MRSRPRWFYAQSAVAPFRTSGDSLEVLLITSMRSRRWTIPKGVIEPGMTPAASAAKEAFEEAGVRGDVGAVSLGSYTYQKWGGTCAVQVFPMHVRELLDVWPESDARTRQWFTHDDAIASIGTDALRPILESLRTLMGRR